MGINRSFKDVGVYMNNEKRIRNSPPFDQLRKIRVIRNSFSVYKGNHRALIKTQNQFYEDLNIKMENSVRRWRKQRKIGREIHNMIASAKSYIDHISKLTTTLQLLQNKLDEEFYQNPLYHFIRALRNFIIHYEPLAIDSKTVLSSLEIGRFNEAQYESMDKTSFMDYLTQRTRDGNKTGDRMALDYIDELPDIINLNTVFKEFDDLICSFHKWLILTYVNEYKSELRFLYSEIKDHHRFALEKGFNLDYPITESQLRHLNLLLVKAEEQAKSQL